MPLDSSHLPHSRFIGRFLGGLPQDVADSFTPEQLAAVERAFGMRYAPGHAVDVRRSIGVLGRRFYLVLLLGRERTGDARRARSYLPYGVAAALVSAALILFL